MNEIKVGTKRYNCELRLWKACQGYVAPDCLCDLEPEMAMHYDGDKELYVYTENEFDTLCNYWKEECLKANDKNLEAEFINLLSEEIDDGCEFHFICDELGGN